MNPPVSGGNNLAPTRSVLSHAETSIFGRYRGRIRPVDAVEPDEEVVQKCSSLDSKQSSTRLDNRSVPIVEDPGEGDPWERVCLQTGVPLDVVFDMLAIVVTAGPPHPFVSGGTEIWWGGGLRPVVVFRQFYVPII